MQREFEFVVSKELAKIGGDFIFKAELFQDNDSLYKVSWQIDGIEDWVEYSVQDVKDNLEDKKWFIINRL